MAPRKRKAPKGKGKRQQPGLASRGAVAVGSLGLRGAGALGNVGLRGAGALGTAGLHGAGALGGVVARHPTFAGGAMAFAIIFSFVATNALWYQPGNHPSPMFRTRDPASPYAIAGRKSFLRSQSDAGDVTTFRIERPDDVAAAIAGNATPQATPALAASVKPAPAGKAVTVPTERPADINSKAATADPVAAAILNAEKPPADIKTASVAQKKPPIDPIANINMVMQIQKGLSNIAYSNVSIDGVAGETTRTAILHFQKHYRLPETGVPDMVVLKKLREIGAL